jgi:lipopolysaccharide transport system permease protein
MLPWLAVSEAVGRAPYTLLEHRNFIKKILFPVETLPAILVCASLVTQFFAVLVFLAFLAAARGGVPATALWIPALLVPQLLLTLGLGWGLAALGLFVRDLGQVMGFLLTLWFFLTPICYPQESLPPESLPLLARNPIYQLVHDWRTVLLDRRAPDWGGYFNLVAGAYVVCIAGYALYRRLRPAFADVA